MCMFKPMCVCVCVWKCIYPLSRTHVHVCIQPRVCSTLCVFVCVCENVSVPCLVLTSMCVFNPMCVCVCMWKRIHSLSRAHIRVRVQILIRFPAVAPGSASPSSRPASHPLPLRLCCSDSCMQVGPMFPHLPGQQLSLFWINKYWESPSEFYYRILEHNKNSDAKKNNFPWEGGSRVGGTYEHLWLIHVVIWQRLTQHCKVIILQLRIKIKKKPNFPNWETISYHPCKWSLYRILSPFLPSQPVRTLAFTLTFHLTCWFQRWNHSCTWGCDLFFSFPSHPPGDLAL